MRLFVAADISDDTRTQLLRVRHQLEPLLARARRAPRITWVSPEVAHVTLRFIGEVTGEKAAALRNVICGNLDRPPFSVQWSTVGTFPSGRSPRVVWLGATHGALELSALAAAVNVELESLVGPADERPFKPHLTVARIKDSGAGVAWRQTVAEVTPGVTTTHVDHVTLYQSQLSSKGPTYHPLSRWTLSSR
jgi:2'-5' RNA ligase